MEKQVTVTVSSNICQLSNFKPGDDWDFFSELLEQYFEANGIEARRRTAFLLTLIDEEVYKILKNFCDPDLPKEKSYEELIQLLETQFKTKVSIFRKRIQFDNLKQKEKSISEWFVKVKHFASFCNFGAILTERVKDKFVTGLRSGSILDRLCEEDETRTLQELYELAVKKESAVRDSSKKDLRNSNQEYELNKVQKFSSKGKKNTNFTRSSKSYQDSNSPSNSQEKKNRSISKTEVLCFACNKSDHDFSISGPSETNSSFSNEISFNQSNNSGTSSSVSPREGNQERLASLRNRQRIKPPDKLNL
ncbi:hypothetical protein NQ315_004963 [Exocentrus adspersus]|uniref:Gag protein n=1 Tax=Exocentrus adspersus TaxID=1586481 RepID=A0AAV8V7Y8_9CUCU|nr:hypothetical protein NQ315_004963 [Exocentrus adspersus]